MTFPCQSRQVHFSFDMEAVDVCRVNRGGVLIKQKQQQALKPEKKPVDHVSPEMSRTSHLVAGTTVDNVNNDD